MRATRRGLAALYLLLGLALVPAGAQAAKPVKIGAFLAITGSAALLGEPEAKTLRLFVDRINRSGGVAGSELSLTIYDTASEIDRAVDQAGRLLQVDQVDLLIGGTTTGETMAVLPLVEARQVPLISLAAGFAVMDTPHNWVFAVPHSDRMAINRIYDELQARKLTRIGVIAGSAYYDATCRGAVHALAAEHGISIVAEEAYGLYGVPTDLIPHLKRMRSTPGIQAIISCGFGASSEMVVRDYHGLSVTLPLYFTQGIGSARFLADLDGAAEGVRAPLSAAVIGDQLPSDDPQKPVAAAYAAAFREAYDEPPSSFGGHAYDALMIAVAAIGRAGGADPAKIRDEIERTHDFVGVEGIFTMSPTDHRGLTKKSLHMVEVRDNAWKLVAPR